jgi:hypothetical protein
LSHTPSVRLAMGGIGPSSVGAQGLTWADWQNPVVPAMRINRLRYIFLVICIIADVSYNDGLPGAKGYVGILGNCY